MHRERLKLLENVSGKAIYYLPGRNETLRQSHGSRHRSGPIPLLNRCPFREK